MNAASEPSAAAKAALLHMLGLDADHVVPWRNHYVSAPDDPVMAELVALGLASRTTRPAFVPTSDAVWRATAAGEAVAAQWRPRRTRSQERYHHFLGVRDAYGDLTFAAYLRGRLYRRDAHER